jgi:hypothetical protein
VSIEGKVQQLLTSSLSGGLLFWRDVRNELHVLWSIPASLRERNYVVHLVSRRKALEASHP